MTELDVRPDPARLADGWTRRFVAEGARAEEMIELYRALGFEVAAEPIRPAELPAGCPACLAAEAERYRSIYTRRPEPEERTP